MYKLKCLEPVASNMTEITTSKGTRILFSYQTPVAGYDEKGAFRTNVWYSMTTTRHINKYLEGKDVGRVVEQEYINDLI